MKTTHTPGPWIDDGHDGIETQIVNSKWGAVAHVIHNGDSSQQSANARLIAAAPELLKALQTLFNMRNGCGMPITGPWEDARSAIARATGGDK